MKFKDGSILFYVNPFVFTIEKVQVDFGVKDEINPNIINYIDQTGAYLAEHDLFDNLTDAKFDALNKLNKFYVDVSADIFNANPEIDMEG